MKFGSSRNIHKADSTLSSSESVPRARLRRIRRSAYRHPVDIGRYETDLFLAQVASLGACKMIDHGGPHLTRGIIGGAMHQVAMEDQQISRVHQKRLRCRCIVVYDFYITQVRMLPLISHGFVNGLEVRSR